MTDKLEITRMAELTRSQYARNQHRSLLRSQARRETEAGRIKASLNAGNVSGRRKPITLPALSCLTDDD